MVGEGPAAFFSDACLILSLDLRPASASHIVGHLLREVESAVREVLEPQANSRQGESGDGHQLSIRAVLDELQIPAEEPAARFWLGVTGAGNPSGLAMRAHRSARGVPRPVDGEFLEFASGMEELLDRVLTRFKARYVGIFTRLDEILAEGPSKKRAARLKKNFPQNDACLSYFFGRASAAWLSPLAEKGYFASPPGLVLHPEDSTAEMPFWPESNFLARVAAEAPGEAVDVVLGIPATDNMRVNSDLVEVAVRVPADQSARVAPKIAEMAAGSYGVLVPTRLGDLCRHLADGGYADEAMLVADPLLGKVPALGGSRAGDTWSYAEVLREDVPALVSAAGLRPPDCGRWSCWQMPWTRRSPCRLPPPWRRSGTTSRPAGGRSLTGSPPAPIPIRSPLWCRPCGMQPSASPPTGRRAPAKSSLSWRHTTGPCSAGSSSTCSAPSEPMPGT
jgi:hypothetical protein